MEQFVSQDPRSYSLYFDLKIWFRARKVTGTFEKRTPRSCLYHPDKTDKIDRLIKASGSKMALETSSVVK